MRKKFDCKLVCKSNCCSYLFLRIPKDQLNHFNQHSKLVVDKDYTNWEALDYHRGVLYMQFEGVYTITVIKKYKIHTHPNGNIYAFMRDPCIHQGEENKCNIYEDRPDFCREYPCAINVRYPGLRWFYNIAEGKGCTFTVASVRRGPTISKVNVCNADKPSKTK